MWLFLAFLLVPLIEIALFIQIGGAIGLWPTLVIVLVTAVAGAYLVRTQGLVTMENLRQSVTNDEAPTEYLAHGLMIFFSGALLLTPGFFTDAVGFALLLPFVRQLIYLKIRSKVHIHHMSAANASGRPGHHGHAADFIDGEFTEVHPEDAPADHPTNTRTH